MTDDDRPFTDDPSGGMSDMTDFIETGKQVQATADAMPDAIPEEYAAKDDAAYARGQHIVGNVLYAWQMQVESGWNLIAMKLPSGQAMPLVTSSMPLAWEAFEIAQAHANLNVCQVRLAAFKFETVAAIVDPND